MPTTLNKRAYQRLIDEDIIWLQRQPRSIEREHIEQVLQWSVDQLYPKQGGCKQCQQQEHGTGK